MLVRLLHRVGLRTLAGWLTPPPPVVPLEHWEPTRAEVQAALRNARGQR
jgi:hypothetical protein